METENIESLLDDTARLNSINKSVTLTNNDSAAHHQISSVSPHLPTNGVVSQETGYESPEKASLPVKVFTQINQKARTDFKPRKSEDQTEHDSPTNQSSLMMAKMQVKPSLKTSSLTEFPD